MTPMQQAGHALAAEQEFEEFIYCITHDLKAYSRAIRVIPEWIEEDLSGAGLDLPGDVRDHMSMLRDYASGMDRMLEALTALSRVGRLADTASSIDLNAALLRAWRSLPDSTGAGFHLPAHKLFVHGPDNDLQRLFTALLSNAVQHASSAPSAITVAAREQDGRVVVTIADDGPGIDPALREKVFEPLHTLRPKDETGQAGMGLAIARKVVTLAGGTIRIEAASTGTGCAVIFDLPAARA